MESFGTRLANYRKEKGLTQNDIAERLSISPQAVSKWENDQSSPDIDSLIKLSEIFNISLDELLGKDNPKTEYVEKQTKKDINKMLFRIIVESADGDQVKLNLPMAVVRIFANSEAPASFIKGNKALEGIDFKQILDLVEQGIIGELITVDSKDGDHVRILVE